jgi:hypothetical protein
LLELGYQGSHSLRVPERWTYNQAFLPPVAGNPNNSLTYVSQCTPGAYPNNCDPIEQRVPFANLIATAGDSPNIGTAMYHGMTFKADKRFSHGLQMLGSFTWSKVTDQVSELQTYGGISTVVFQYAHSLNLEQAPAGFDQTRRLVMSWVYELPVGKGKPLLNRTGLINRLLGGWQMNGIQTFADGTPFTVLCGACGDRTQTGASSTASVRPNVSGNPLPSGFQRTRTAWFLTSVYSTPQLGTLGNSGRNTLRSTGQRATDFSLVKDETIHENLKLQFRGEFFNLFSSHFYTPVFPTATMTSSNFGSLYPVGGDAGNLFNPRIIQVALRVTF